MSSMCPMLLAASRTSSVFNAGSKRCRCVASSSPEDDDDEDDDDDAFSARADERKPRRSAHAKSNDVDTASSDRRRRRPTPPPRVVRRRIFSSSSVKASEFSLKEEKRRGEETFDTLFLGLRVLYILFFCFVRGGADKKREVYFESLYIISRQCCSLRRTRLLTCPSPLDLNSVETLFSSRALPLKIRLCSPRSLFWF